MLKVLHLITSLNKGGIEMWLLSMLKEIIRGEVEMDICCQGTGVGSLAQKAEDLGAKVFWCPLKLDHLSFAHQLKQILKDRNYQILHIHTHTYSGFPTWIAKQQGIPTVVSFHNTQFPAATKATRSPGIRQLRMLYGRISINYALRHADVITGCSQGVLDSVQLRHPQTGSVRRIIHYGVSTPQVSTPADKAEFRKSFGWSADTPVVLHVGRFVPQKNHLSLLSIFQRVLDEIPNAQLLLIGDGLLRNDIETEISKRHLQKSVRLLGIRDDVLDVMDNCNAFLFPSLFEGFGLVAIEASAAGLPIIGSKIPGLIEAVQDGKTALLHESNDIEGMAASVVEVLSNKAFAKKIGDAGQAWVRENFSLEASAAQLTKVYHECFKQNYK